MAFAALLTDRGVLSITGEDAPHFLNNLVTSAVEGLQPGQSAYGALLTPQGKIISDFLVLRTADGYLLDAPAARLEELRKRFTLYKLRAKVSIAIEALSVLAVWGTETKPALENAFADPRLPGLGFRALSSAQTAESVVEQAGLEPATEAAYHAHRVALGVPEGGRDFAFDDAFPHEADMDQLGGVDFRKGCYIGQEVVSRMQHRATARTRVVPVRMSGQAESGTAILAGEKTAGTLGSVSGEKALALIRIDRVDDALEAGQSVTAGDTVLTIEKPDWARFRFPGEPMPDKTS